MKRKAWFVRPRLFILTVGVIIVMPLFAQWSVVGIMPTQTGANPPVEVGMDDLTFLNPDFGYFFYDVPVYSNYIPPVTCLKRTLNGGLGWGISYYHSDDHSQNIKYASFANVDTGFLVITTAMPTLIYMTTNAGMNWLYNMTLMSSVSQIFALKGNYVYFLRGPNLDLYNLDTMVGIYSFPLPFTGGGRLLFFENGAGYMPTTYNATLKAFATLMQTLDHGYSWDTVYHDPAMPFLMFAFPDVSTGYLLSDSGRIMRTSDSGQTWIANVLPQPVKPVSVSFCTPLMGMVLGPSHELYRTNDGGQTWETLTVPPGSYPWRVFMFNDTLAYLAGYQSYYNVLFKTVTGGYANCETLSVSSREITVVPNPAGESCDLFLPVSQSAGEETNIRLFNHLGREVFSFSGRIIGLPFRIPLDKLSPGLYILQIATAEGRGSVKVLHY